jgi:rhombotail lipoprotein
VFDIRSRALWFTAAGRSRLEGRATAIQASQEMRAKSIEGFEMAVDNMIAQLEVALAAFREQVKTGSVRGAGTPAITVAGASGSAGGTGAGAGGAVELGFALALGLTVLAQRRGGGGDRRTQLGQRARA